MLKVFDDASIKEKTEASMLTIDTQYKNATIDNIIGYTSSYLSDKYQLPLDEVLKKIYASIFILELKDIQTQYYNEDITRLVARFEQELFR